METPQLQKLFATFLTKYDAVAKDSIWAKQSQEFKDFWKTQILAGSEKRELDDLEIDKAVRILDKSGKGSTKESEAVAKAMIPQGAWRRMFNEIKADKELRILLNSIFVERENRADLIDKLYKANEQKRNNLTGQSGNAICAMLAAVDPVNNLSVISLNGRRRLYEALDIGSDPISTRTALAGKLPSPMTTYSGTSSGLARITLLGHSRSFCTQRTSNHCGSPRRVMDQSHRRSTYLWLAKFPTRPSST